MEKTDILKLTARLILRSEIQDIMDISCVDLLTAEKMKLEMLGYLHDEINLAQFAKGAKHETV